MMIFYILQGLEETIVRVELLEKSRDLIYVSVLHANWAPSKVLLRYRASWQRLITQMTNRQSQRILARKWKEWPTRRGIDLGFARGQPHRPSADLRRVVFGRRFPDTRKGAPINTRLRRPPKAQGRGGGVMKKHDSLHYQSRTHARSRCTQRRPGAWMTDSATLFWFVSFSSFLFYGCSSLKIIVRTKLLI